VQERARRQPRQNRAQATAAAVVQAAEHLLVEVGYARASTNAIASRAGVSVGSLYQYFSSKEDIYRAVARRHREEVVPPILTMLSTLHDPKQDIAEASVRLMRIMAEVHGRNPALMRALESEIGWLEHEDDAAFDLAPMVKDVLALRAKRPDKELETVAALLVEVVSHLSRWLVHARPAGMDIEVVLAASRRMIRAMLPG